MRVVFMGTPDFSVGTLRELAKAGHEIAGVISQPDKPKGRGKNLQPTPVKEAAMELGLPVYQPQKVRDPEFIQVMKELNPDVIVVNGEPKADKSGNSAAEDILSNPDYASLKAVQDHKVYGTPNAPFSWVDRPAGPNRLIGMRWFSALIYPEYIKCDINEEIHKFFDLFYHVDLSDEQLENVLKGTL